MDSRQVALKLVLDALHVSDEITTIDDRKRVQKAIYLGQRAGVEMGYRYSWYLKGPYCSDLARDYYGLAESVRAGGTVAGRSLREEASDALARVAPLMTPPAEVDLPQEDWLELLASLDFLRKVSRKSYEEAVETLKAHPSKVRFAQYAAVAEKKLADAQLLP